MNYVVSQLLEVLLRRLSTEMFAAAGKFWATPKTPVIRLQRVKEFWTDPRLFDGRRVSLDGQLSLYAPMLFGSPSAKRDLHRDIRRRILDITHQAEKDERSVKETTVDALLSYTAGQMVFRMPTDIQYVYLGLYHSIVRNSVPVFVEREYFKTSVMPYFADESPSEVRECRVTATIIDFSGDFSRDISQETELKRIFDTYEVELPSAGRQFALRVSGSSDGTSIKVLQPARYLDGDIWVALRTDESERVVSRFVNLSDPQDIQEQSKELIEDIKRYLGGGQIISQFDQVNAFFGRSQIVDHQRTFKRDGSQRDQRPE